MKKLLAALVIATVIGFAAVALAIALYPVPEPNDIAVAEATRVTYDDGSTVIGEIGDVSRNSIPLSDVPLHVQQAVLAAEDRTFYDHSGFSPTAIARAFFNNLRGGATQGGSTITQQYVKNAFLSQEQSITRKAEELILSVKLEFVTSKDQILEGYLNTIYFGRGAYGIEAASIAYFGKPASELTISQGAALAGLIQSPGNYEPEDNRRGLRQRWNYVLDGMVGEGWLDEAEREDLRFPKFVERSSGNRLGGQVGHLIEAARQDLIANGWTEAEIDGGGLTITTNIRKDAQDAMVAAVESQGPTSNTEGLRIGVAAVDPIDGSVIALYGGKDYVQDQFNNATQARAQAGSTFKPFALAAAFEDDIGLSTLWNGNSPQTINGYTLENLANTSYGTVTLLKATESSINTPYVQLTANLGVDPVYDVAVAAGVPESTPGMDKNLTFVLGTASPRPIDMASAFATFGARGVFHRPGVVKEVYSFDRRLLYTHDRGGQQQFDTSVADTVNYALQRVVTNGSGFRAQALGRPAAGKTGTTDSNLSSWYVGYTPQVSAAVMLAKSDAVGNPITLSGTGGLSSVTGGSFPAAIWTAFAQGYLQDKPVEQFGQPDPLLTGTGGADVPAPTPEESEEPTEEPTDEPTTTPEPEPSQPVDPADPDEPAGGGEGGGGDGGGQGGGGQGGGQGDG